MKRPPLPWASVTWVSSIMTRLIREVARRPRRSGRRRGRRHWRARFWAGGPGCRAAEQSRDDCSASSRFWKTPPVSPTASTGISAAISSTCRTSAARKACVKDTGAQRRRQIRIGEHRQQRLPVEPQDALRVARDGEGHRIAARLGDGLQHHRPLALEARPLDAQHQRCGGIEQPAGRRCHVRCRCPFARPAKASGAFAIGRPWPARLPHQRGGRAPGLAPDPVAARRRGTAAGSRRAASRPGAPTKRLAAPQLAIIARARRRPRRRSASARSPGCSPASAAAWAAMVATLSSRAEPAPAPSACGA